ncbi:MAG: hypothetical protein KC708_08110, partial [Anaerolineae bacterium]|nr:hypothetical protein [Anaerolineae bacterium]
MTFNFAATAAQLESEIRANRLLNPPTPWANELIYPSYADLSLRNIGHTVAQLLGAPLPNSTPLDERVWGDALPADINRVVVFLMDGMGYLHLQMLMEEDEAVRESVMQLTQGNGPVPLTS